MNIVPFTALTSKATLRIADDKSHRDYAVIFNSLLFVMDLVALPGAAYLATQLHLLWFETAPFGQRAESHYLLATIAILAPVLLYDNRFISVASRGQDGALARYFVAKFMLLAVGMSIVGTASGVTSAVPFDVVVMWLVASFAFTALVRLAMAMAVRRCVHKGLLTERIAIVGTGSRATQLARQLQLTHPITPEFLGIFDDIQDPNWPLGPHEPATGTVDELVALGQTRRIDWIFLALPHADEERILSVVTRLKALAVPIAMCPQALESIAPRRIDFIGDVMPVTLLHPATKESALLQSVSPFLPRWMTTMPMLCVLLVQRAWVGVRPAQVSQTGHLLCELDNFDLDEFTAIANSFGQNRFGYAVTPNVDHFIRLHDDTAFRDLYGSAEYVLLDSRFLSHLLWWSGRGKLPVCTGSDLTSKLMSGMAGSSDRIVIVGGSDEQVATLAAKYDLRHVAHHNPPMGFVNDETAVATCLQFVEANSPFRFCLLAVGSPQQEVLAQRLRSRGVARGMALCVGASLNFLTGAERRAPRWMQLAGLEWIYRMAQDPGRLAARYLIRGPRIFWLLRKTKFKLRAKQQAEAIAPLRAA
ncbi:MAG TPA: WecB/TagA/CpsF family glycosyltransferase [Steroidobacteraceae bacterium]|nr:WecB/TagA/CpsF family glycosyltransferase [Steroidobacteraceae bacterium]